MRLRHPSLDPDQISRAFDLKPSFAWKAGSRAGDIVHISSVWYGLLTTGTEIDDYEEALKSSVLLLESRQGWLNDVFGSDGELDVIFGYWTDLDEGKICQTSFYPELLARLSRLNAGIEVNIWKQEK